MHTEENIRDPLLLITGRRRKRHYLAMIDGQQIWLSRGLFLVLCELVEASSKGSGFSTWPSVSIHRLRKAIDDVFDDVGISEQWIQTGGNAEYRLSVAKKNIRIDTTFDELPFCDHLCFVKSLRKKSIDRSDIKTI